MRDQYYPLMMKYLENAMNVSHSPNTFGKEEEKNPSCHTKLKKEDFCSTNLTETDLEKIVTRVGTKIENIFDLTPGQKWMLGDSTRTNSEFVLQFLFKVVMPLDPYLLRQRLEKVSEKNDNLRSVYLNENLTHPYRIVLKERQPELWLEDLSEYGENDIDEKLKNLVEADCRRGFDLEKDTLLRMAVYKLSEQDTYAILVSQPHINSDGISVLLLLKEIFIDYAKEMTNIDREMSEYLPYSSYESYAKWLAGRDLAGELDYWKNLLKDMPNSTRVPGLLWKLKGEHEVSQAKMIFSPKTQQGIKEKPMAYKVTCNSFIQAAWGIFLMKMYNTNDVVFGAITSGRDGSVPGGMSIMGGFSNAIPVRANLPDKDMKISEFMRNLQKQFLTSVTHAFCSPDEINKALGRREPLFDHLLNFHNFGTTAAFSVMTGGKDSKGFHLISSKIFDNLSADLTVYFQYHTQGLGCRFVYNRRKMTDSRIRILMREFEKVVDQIALGTEDITIGDINCADLGVFDSALKDERELEDEIVAFLKGVDIFKDLSEGEYRVLAKSAQIKEYLSDDFVFKTEDEIHDIMFVYDGAVELCHACSEGWCQPLTILQTGKLLTAAGIWDEEKNFYGAKTYGESKILSIPGNVIRRICSENFEVTTNIMKELNEFAKTYSLLWINQ